MEMAALSEPEREPDRRVVPEPDREPTREVIAPREVPVVPRTELGDRWNDVVKQLVERGLIAALVRELALQSECVSVKDDNGLSYKAWAKEVSLVLERIEDLFWPKVIVAGGGISRDHEQWIPLLTNRTPVIPAVLKNTAGIVGAAMAIDAGLAP